MRFGDNLRNLRIQRKMTQMELAKALETSQSSITAWECEAREPDFSTVAKIAKFFNVPMSALIPSVGNMDETFVGSVAESLRQNKKLRQLYDKVKFMSDANLDILLSVASAISKDGGEEK